jgi:hypothetical protein
MRCIALHGEQGRGNELYTNYFKPLLLNELRRTASVQTALPTPLIRCKGSSRCPLKYNILDYHD